MDGSESQSQKRITVWPYYVGLGVVVLLMASGLILYHLLWSEHKWILDAVSAIGIAASFLGVVLALIQIKQANLQIALSQKKIDNVDAIAKATQSAVESNKEEIRKLLSFPDMAHLEEVIRNAQDHLCNRQYILVLHLEKNIKTELLRIHALFPTLAETLKIDFQKIISNNGSDIGTLTDHILTKRSKSTTDTTASINAKMIHDNLEEVRDAVIKIEMELRKDKL